MVPVKIYYPKPAEGKEAGPCPVIIFSHGLGGSREGYKYLGEYWASYGYVSVHLQHIGSDDAVWKGAGANAKIGMNRAVADPNNAVNRPLDVRFAIDQVDKLNREDPLFKGRLDMDHVGMAGHSFGAYTTLAVAGEVFIPADHKEVSMPDSRVKAAIAMSSPVPSANAGKETLDRAYAKIKIPVFHMTGTKDSSPIGGTTIAQRRLPFDHSKPGDKYLVTFTDGDHMIFSGRLVRSASDTAFQRLICMGSLAFWDAYLKGIAPAKTWLADGDFEKTLGQSGKFEKK